MLQYYWVTCGDTLISSFKEVLWWNSETPYAEPARLRIHLFWYLVHCNIACNLRDNMYTDPILLELDWGMLYNTLWPKDIRKLYKKTYSWLVHWLIQAVTWQSKAELTTSRACHFTCLQSSITGQMPVVTVLHQSFSRIVHWQLLEPWRYLSKVCHVWTCRGLTQLCLTA